MEFRFCRWCNLCCLLFAATPSPLVAQSQSGQQVVLQGENGFSGGPTSEPLVRVIDLSVGESTTVALSDGSQATVKMLDLEETRDQVRGAVRRAQVKIEVNNQPITLTCAAYHLPVTIAGVRIDCSVTRGYLDNSRNNDWELDKDARLRLWPAGSPLLVPDTFVCPLNERLFESRTWMPNEPTDGGLRFDRPIYYHSGCDIGGCEGLFEVVAATDGLVVSVGLDVLDEYRNDSPVMPRYDVVYLLDQRGWYYRYSHLKEIDDSIKPGRIIRMKDRIGVLGKEGGSGGWSHLHFEIKCVQPSGKWGTQAAYAFLWEAYQKQHKPKLLAIARPGHLARVGERVELDGGHSWSASGQITRYEWVFDDGTTSSGVKATRIYDKPGTYSEVLKITDSAGNIDYDFTRVKVVSRRETSYLPPDIHAAYFPTHGIKAGNSVTFMVRSFVIADGHGQETWDFGDGSPIAEVRSDGDVFMEGDSHAPDGYATTTHSFRNPGHYLVRVERTNAEDEQAVAHLHVNVAE